VASYGVVFFIVISIVLSCLAGVVSWYLVEAPVLRWARALGHSFVRKTDDRAELLVS
jgi:peptidoglycan/LPS O-acetylase OafA/YrhL